MRSAAIATIEPYKITVLTETAGQAARREHDCSSEDLHVYMCTMWMSGGYRNQKRVSDPLEPELDSFDLSYRF